MARRRRRVHPRVGGGAVRQPRSVSPPTGPSPRGRGSLRVRLRHRSLPRSIPAWAGEPPPRSVRRARAAVHPRVGGGASEDARIDTRDDGPSPRGRGSPDRMGGGQEPRGSIPAWAGEPSCISCTGTTTPVHPRVGGGAVFTRAILSIAWGPSPRGRGSRGALVGRLAAAGSIPAWAGEPRAPRPRPPPGPVHPRVGGGASRRRHCATRRDGPSPRGRGSHGRAGGGWRHGGSIPAWAGEPRTVAKAAPARRVHPRVGGGAGSPIESRVYGRGPSPRGRGSLLARRAEEFRLRSIPAWAGEPGARRPTRPSRAVHPRVGGGAYWAAVTLAAAGGPSPRGRGSRARADGARLRRRSIPAWAGEPDRIAVRTASTKVHPRVGGGAEVPAASDARARGPSPRGRGSPSCRPWASLHYRSIPAWAGEPQ